jgi:hypothetical protein
VFKENFRFEVATVLIHDLRIEEWGAEVVEGVIRPDLGSLAGRKDDEMDGGGGEPKPCALAQLLQRAHQAYRASMKCEMKMWEYA